MKRTRESLLVRLKDPRDDEAWREFHALYAPLLLRYALARGLQPSDAEEVRDQCLGLAAQKLPDFDYDRERGHFRGWLYRMAHGRIVDLLRARRPRRLTTDAAAELADTSGDPRRLWDAHWRKEHLRYALLEAGSRVSSRDFRIFELLLFEDASVPDVCAQLDVGPNQVYKAKARVLREVRAVLTRLGEEDPPPG